MRVRTLLMIFIMLLVILFAIANQDVFTATSSLWLGFTTVQAPLGLVMLGMLVFTVFLALAFIGYQQSLMLADARRTNKELQTQRTLADQAEASRLLEMRQELHSEVTKLTEHVAQTRSATLARLDKIEQDIRVSLEQSTNSIAASIGELEDRLERAGLGRSGAPE